MDGSRRRSSRRACRRCCCCCSWRGMIPAEVLRDFCHCQSLADVWIQRLNSPGHYVLLLHGEASATAMQNRVDFHFVSFHDGSVRSLWPLQELLLSVSCWRTVVQDYLKTRIMSHSFFTRPTRSLIKRVFSFMSSEHFCLARMQC